MNLKIIAVALVAAVGSTSHLSAQVMISPALQSGASEDAQTLAQAAKPSIGVISLYAMSMPDPLLKYRLWPAAEHRQSENSSPLVSRALLLKSQVSRQKTVEFSERYNEWIEMRLEDLPGDQIRAVLVPYATALNELRRAENLMQLDYDLQLDQMSGPEIIATLLPEFQEMKSLARVLQLRARLAVSEGRWDDFVDDCRLGFRLSEIAGHSTDFLLGRILGFGISGMILDVIEEAIQRPRCPNLYWALVSLPTERLFELRESLEFESVFMGRILGSAGSLPDKPIGENAARNRLLEIVRDAGLVLSNNRMSSEQSAALLAGMYVVTMAEPSRELLAETETWGERAYELSSSEAVLRAAQLRYLRIRDRWIAWSMLPYEAWEPYRAELNEAFDVTIAPYDVLSSLVQSLMPAVGVAVNAARRRAQQRNFLCTLESIRMHTYETGGFPESIETIRPVPAWHDTLSVKPFGYQKSSEQRATLTRAARWPGDTETTLLLELKGES